MRGRDHDRRRRQHEQRQQRGRADDPDQRPSGEPIAARPGRRRRPSRLAMNGAAARAASPIGSRPPRRAIVGSRVVTSARRHPGPDRRDRVEGEVAPDRALLARRREGRATAGTRRTSKQPAGLRGELSGSALGSPSRRSRFAPGIVGPPSSRGGSAISYGISQVGFVATTVGPGWRRDRSDRRRASGTRIGPCRIGRGSSRPVRVGFDRPRSAVSPWSLAHAVKKATRREEMIRGVLARLQPGTRQAGRTDRVGRLLAVPRRCPSLRTPFVWVGAKASAMRRTLSPRRITDASGSGRSGGADDRHTRWPAHGGVPSRVRAGSRDLWGCVVSTGPGYRGTRAEDATGPR